MTVRVLFPHHWHTQPWKNDGGITHEIIRADDAEGARWRLSIAEVAADGPLSRFDGIDRVILMLTGNGFHLHGVGASPARIVQTLQPFAFAGEAAIDCTLVSGPVRDFNLMSRRGAVHASLDVLQLTGERQQLQLQPDTFIFVANGAVFAELHEHGFCLDASQTLHAQNETGFLQLSAHAGHASVLLIRLR